VKALLLTLVAACVLVTASTALARRTATKSESRAMWRVVDKKGDCVQRRGKISTVASKRWRWGLVTIADSHCGNGDFVMRRAKSGGKWTIRVAGSDISSPDRCDEIKRKAPLRVLRDLLNYDPLCT
jgi:hypothetical protein